MQDHSGKKYNDKKYQCSWHEEVERLRAQLAEQKIEKVRLRHIILNADGTLTAMQMQGKNTINVGTMLALININTQFEGAAPPEEEK